MKWETQQLDVCESTFDIARSLPAWCVVSARRQTKGRGRFNRSWYADEGGLWATYNLPLDETCKQPWELTPLVAGAALMKMLERFHIPGLRLRWPNDLLVGKAKLAGILVERPKPCKVGIGVGINVCNSITMLTQLQDPPTRLADILTPCPTVPQLRDMLGNALAETFFLYMQEGPEGLVRTLASAWGPSLPVVAVTDTERHCGFFSGVDTNGSPTLRRADGVLYTVPGTSILRLKELI